MGKSAASELLVTKGRPVHGTPFFWRPRLRILFETRSGRRIRAVAIRRKRIDEDKMAMAFWIMAQSNIEKRSTRKDPPDP